MTVTGVRVTFAEGDSTVADWDEVLFYARRAAEDKKYRGYVESQLAAAYPREISKWEIV